MGNFFPRWTNLLPLQIIVCLVILGGAVTAGVSYYFTPKYTRVGYQPSQPIPFSHKIHVTQHGMDCRYCHSFAESSSGHSNIPTTATCMNCHKVVKNDSPKLAPLRESWNTGKPIEWVRIHELPDYAYFNHAAHLNRGISCVRCHGDVDEMDVVHQVEPQSMSWCLDCHRAPEKELRPLEEIVNFDWAPEQVNREEFYKKLMAENDKSPADLIEVVEEQRSYPLSGDAEFSDLIRLAESVYGKGSMTQEEIGLHLKKAWDVSPPLSCTGCHR